MSDRFAKRVLIDHVEHEVWIDGFKIPWWIGFDGPEVEHDPLTRTHTLTIPILVDGFIAIAGEGTETIHDPVLGDVGAAARRMVREGFLEAFPWLDIDKED
jgi:hypothetical protein